MSAGSGIQHSEFNASKTEPVHFLQIWLIPDEAGLKPSYEQKRFEDSDKRGRLRLVASPKGEDGSVVIHLDARVYASVLGKGERVSHALAPGRKVWIQMIRGGIGLGGKQLEAGDGAAIEGERDVAISAETDGTEFLLFDLP